MNRLPALAIFSLVAVSLPRASVADERLDAPGPGYRQQVERFSPGGVPANSFQLQIEPTISAPGPLSEADQLEDPDPGYREQLERFSRSGNGAASFHLKLEPPLAPADFPARMPGNTAYFPQAVELPSGIAPLDDFVFSEPIRLFDLPRTFGIGDAPSMSVPAR